MKKCLIINCEAGLPHRKDVVNCMNVLPLAFIKYNFEVKIITYADIEFFKTGLQGYDVIFLITHGKVFNKKSWILTNEVLFCHNKNKIDKECIDDFISPDYGTKENKPKFLAISHKFFEKYYPENSLQNSLIYFVPCCGLKHKSHFAKTFINKGAKVVIGWDEIHSIGIDAGVELIRNLLYRKNCTLQKAINGMKNAPARIYGCKRNDLTIDILEEPIYKGNTYVTTNEKIRAKLIFYPYKSRNYKIW